MESLCFGKITFNQIFGNSVIPDEKKADILTHIPHFERKRVGGAINAGQEISQIKVGQVARHDFDASGVHDPIPVNSSNRT